MAEVDAKKVDFLLLREVVVSLATEDENFIHRVRNAGPKHPFLDKMPEEGPASVDAVDRFCEFPGALYSAVCSYWFSAPFSFQGQHGLLRTFVFKFTRLCFLCCSCALVCCVHASVRAAFARWGGGRCRQSWCMLPRPMLSYQKAHVWRSSRWAWVHHDNLFMLSLSLSAGTGVDTGEAKFGQCVSMLCFCQRGLNRAGLHFWRECDIIWPF